MSEQTTAPSQTTAAPAATATPASAVLNTASEPSLAQAQASPTTDAPATGGAQPSEDWVSNLPETQRGYIQKKGFKDMGSIVDSYINLEKAIGVPKERLLQLPENLTDPKLMNDVYAKIGRPETPDGYKINLPKEAENSEEAKFIKSTFHELGLTKQQGETLFAKLAESSTKKAEAEAQAKNQALAQQEIDLKRKWGGAYDQKVKSAKIATKEFGITMDMVDKIENAIGFAGVMELLDNIGSKLGEASFVGTNGAQGMLTPAAAKSRISELTSDGEWSKRYLAGDVGAKKEMERLQMLAFGQF